MNQHSTSDKIPKTKRGRKTREKLLHAAEAEFGERGFPEASIASITQRAGVALGTFYVYFESKEEIFRALVSYMGDIEFVRTHRNLYRVVSMAQFVAEDAFREYYSVFASAYEENLKRAAEAGEIREGDSEVWSWALIGMTVFLGMRFADWDEDRPVEEIAAAVSDLVSKGMARNA
jgi:AcrR family transcriptional regulator